MQPLTTLYTYIATLQRKDLQLALIYPWLTGKEKICLRGKTSWFELTYGYNQPYCQKSMLYILNRNGLTPLALLWYNPLPIEVVFSPNPWETQLKKYRNDASSLSWRILQSLKKKNLPFMFFFWGHIYSCLWASRSRSTWYWYL
jgi:hypothetical protein